MIASGKHVMIDDVVVVLIWSLVVSGGEYLVLDVVGMSVVVEIGWFIEMVVV